MNATRSNKSPIEEFLTPEAMLTPGVAGSLTMMITNALAVNFAMPRAWIGLGLSFVFGLLVLVSTRNMLVKGVFYVLNSLVIFCVAVGANGLGTGASQRASVSLTTAAFAQDASLASKGKLETLEYCSDLSSVVAAAQKNNQPPDKILDLIKPCQNVSKDILKSDLLGGPNSSAKSISGKFFSPWRF